MWSLLPRGAQVGIVAFACATVVGLLHGGWAVFHGGEQPGPYLWLGIVITLVGGALAGVADAIWRPVWRWFPAIQRKTFPDLNGTWEGTLVSTWEDPATKERKPPIPTTITIRQRLFSTTVSLRTGESTSHSTRTFLERFPETGHFRIWYSYNNDPQAQVRHRSSKHEGVAYLELDYDTDRNRLTGRYYTDRRTTGDLDVRRN